VAKEMGKDMRSYSSVQQNSTGYLLYAVWFGLLAGLADVSILATQKLFLHKAIHLSPFFVWMAPLAGVCLLAIPGLGLMLMARWCPRFVSLRVTIFVFSFLGFSSLLFALPRLHRVAMLLLAAGLAVQTARLVSKYRGEFHSVVRRTLLWMILLVAVPSLYLHGRQILAERRALAKLPPARPEAPNVLLITLDTVRSPNLSLYGYDRPTTPQLEKFAGTGVIFERAISTSSWTLPSHATMFTGRYPHELSADWLQPLDATYPTLAEVFSTHGYLTAGFVANTYYCGYESGLTRGFVHFEDYLLSPGEIINSSSLGELIFAGRMNSVNIFRRILNNYQFFGRKSAEEVNDSFLSWLSGAQGRPFFAFLNYYDAHDPYIPPQPFADRFAPTTSQSHAFTRLVQSLWAPKSAFRQERFSEKQIRINGYDGSIAYLDQQLGALFDELDKRGLLLNTLVIVTSDHGEQFGAHGLFKHANSLYRQTLHVPLIMAFPGHIPAGGRVREAVTLRDLPVTMLELIDLHGDARLPGNSLARYWNGAPGSGMLAADTLLAEISAGINTPPEYPVSKGDMKSLICNALHYIRNGDGGEELYDFENDSTEQRNIAASEQGRLRLDFFRRRLKGVLTSCGSSQLNARAPKTRTVAR
jgi:arylsulfatase A-like enzyme